MGAHSAGSFSPLSRTKQLQRSTTSAALRVALRAEERGYPELLQSARCRLAVLGIEFGGKWNPEAAQFIWLLARSRARSAPPPLRAGATAAYVSRWSELTSFAAVASLLSLPLATQPKLMVELSHRPEQQALDLDCRPHRPNALDFGCHPGF